VSPHLSPDVVGQELCDFLNDTLRQSVQIDDDIFAVGMADSMFALELIVYIERRYSLKLENEDLIRDNFCSARAMSQLVMKRSAADSQ
jgi:methoxymalonate biosynthesis acyl carrier protein